MIQSYARGGLDWTLGGISLLRRGANIVTGFLEICLMSHACQQSKSIWTMLLMICFCIRP